jgi:hypothetical protein
MKRGFGVQPPTCGSENEMRKSRFFVGRFTDRRRLRRPETCRGAQFVWLAEPLVNAAYPGADFRPDRRSVRRPTSLSVPKLPQRSAAGFVMELVDDVDGLP